MVIGISEFLQMLFSSTVFLSLLSSHCIDSLQEAGLHTVQWFVLWPHYILLFSFFDPWFVLAIGKDVSLNVTVGFSTIIEFKRDSVPIECICAGKFDEGVVGIGRFFPLLEDEGRVRTEREELCVVTLAEVCPAHGGQVYSAAWDWKTNQKRQGKNDILHK